MNKEIQNKDIRTLINELSSKVEELKEVDSMGNKNINLNNVILFNDIEYKLKLKDLYINIQDIYLINLKPWQKVTTI